MKKVVIRVNKIEDSGTAIRLEKMLRKNKNIRNSYVNHKNNTVTLECDNLTSIEQLEEVLDSVGLESYGVDFVSYPKKISLKPIIIFGILLLFVFYASLAGTFHLPLPFVEGKVGAILLGVLTIVFLIYGRDILKKGIIEIIRGRSYLSSMVSITTLLTTIYGFGHLYMFLKGNVDYTNYRYLEVILFLIYSMKVGEYIENINREKLEEEIKQISNTKLQKCNCKREDTFEEVPIEEVQEKEIMVCLPGDQILLDGKVVKNTSHIDESLVTGESLPLLKEGNSKVIAGSTNCECEIEIEVEKTLKDSYPAVIKKQVADAQNKKGIINQRIDRFCSYYAPFIAVISIIYFFLYLIFTKDLNASITKLVQIYLIACPFGLAFATPLSFQKNARAAAKKGLLIKQVETLEEIRKVDTIVFDKTGTLTNGYLSVARINNHTDKTDKEILELLGSMENHSTHPVARGIMKYLRDEKIKTPYEFVTEELPSYGIKATDDENIYYACNSELLEKLDITNSYAEEERKLKLDGNYVMYLVKNKKVIATIGLKDIPTKDADKVIKLLKDKKLNVIMLTGDNEITAAKIAKDLGIENIVAGVTAEEKEKTIEKLREDGHHVVMVGDGMNDAPAQAVSTIGIALKNSNDISIAISDVILSNNNLFKILDLFLVSRSTLRRVKWNILFSLLISLLLGIIFLGWLPFIPLDSSIMIIGMLVSCLLVATTLISIRK